MVKKLKTQIGWEEWCALPDLGLPAIKAKIDTGAKTSAIHAFNIETFEKDGQKFARFDIHPLQKNKTLVRHCVARLKERRVVTSSNGEREKRPVIITHIRFPGKMIEAEITLTSRHKMAFRMLLGREALRKARLLVDPAKSYLLGQIDTPLHLYKTEKENS